MATRFYFSSSVLAPVTPPAPAGADWEHISSRSALQLTTTPDSSGLVTDAYAPDASDHLVNGDAFFEAFVSAALASQTIDVSGVRAQFQGVENHAGNNQFITMKILACSNDGSINRGTILAITRDNTEMATALTNRSLGNYIMGGVPFGLFEGDRLVVEIGWGGTPTGAGGVQGHNAQLRRGGSASGGDLAENDTETGTTFRPWIEFGYTFQFQGAGGPALPPSGLALLGVGR